MSTRPLIRGSVAAGLLVAAACCTITLPAFASRAPELRLKDLAGNAHKLSALRGQIVVVNFWATWCAPCQQELPRLWRLAQEWAGKDVRFVAVSIDEPRDESKIGPMLKRLDVISAADFAVWVGSSPYSLAAFGLGNTVPGTVVIDRDGRVVTRIKGEARDEDIRAAVLWLSNNRNGDREGNPPPALVKRF